MPTLRRPPRPTLLPYTTLFRSSLAELDTLLDELDPAGALPPESHRLPRGHLQGPRPVALPEHWLATADDPAPPEDRKSTRLNSSHLVISYAVFCLKKKSRRPAR